MPTASVIIPCYNAERFVEQTIASAQRQTLRDIEIVCVDDGSTDSTLALLERLARNDRRIRVLCQKNGGEGPARDAGLQAAQGSWLYFLDSDDLMEPTLLEDAINACKRHGSDLVVFRTTTINMQTGEELLWDYAFKREWLSDGTDSFVPREYPTHLFNSFQNWVHNKLFRASFVHEHDLHMQHVHRSADILFTCRALAEARRIALLDKPLHRYRINNPQSAMFTSDSYPLDFYEGFAALRTSLEEHGTWDLYHDSFVNWAIEGVVINLRFTRSLEGFETIRQKMVDEGFDRLDIRSFERSKSDNTDFYDLIQMLAKDTSQEALFHFMVWNKHLHDKTENDFSQYRMEMQSLLSDITRSTSFRIGRAVTAAPRKLRDKLR